jgi:integrase
MVGSHYNSSYLPSKWPITPIRAQRVSINSLEAARVGTRYVYLKGGRGRLDHPGSYQASRCEAENPCPHSHHTSSSPHGDRNEALYVVALHTGLRLGELLGSKWADLNLHAGKLSVRRSLKVTADGLAFGPPKNKASRRSLPLNKTAVGARRAHRKRQYEEKIHAAEWHDLDLIFPNRVGKPMDHNNLYHRE